MDSYLTDSGLEVPAVTTAQMREVDRVAIEGVGPNLYQMMENAGRNLAELCVEMLGEQWTAAEIVVLAGTGGNGGGGICAARHLTNHGGRVMLVVKNEAGLKSVPAYQLGLYRDAGGQSVEPEELPTLKPSLIVDAVLGYSITGAPHGVAVDLMTWSSESNVPVLALDVPSGIDSTTGTASGVHVSATATMTLALPKAGLDVAAVGDLWLADIGIPRGVYDRAGVAPPPADLFSGGYRVRLAPS